MNISENKELFLGVGTGMIIVGLGIALSPDNNLDTQQNLTAEATVSIDIESERIKKEKELAQIRINSGTCNKISQKITPDMTVTNLKEGAIVCDGFGNTAAVGKKGKLKRFARGVQ